jgi:hypothetical protein
MRAYVHLFDKVRAMTQKIKLSLYHLFNTVANEVEVKKYFNLKI